MGFEPVFLAWEPGTNKDAKDSSLYCLAVHLLRPGEWVLLAKLFTSWTPLHSLPPGSRHQFNRWFTLTALIAGLSYTHLPKPHSHPGQGTNITPLFLLAQLQAGFEPTFLALEVGTLTRTLKTAVYSVSRKCESSGQGSENDQHNCY